MINKLERLFHSLSQIDRKIKYIYIYIYTEWTVLIFFSEIVDILSEKCKIEKEEVKEKYENFQKNYPEGEITKDEFLQTMSVRHPRD